MRRKIIDDYITKLKQTTFQLNFLAKAELNAITSFKLADDAHQISELIYQYEKNLISFTEIVDKMKNYKLAARGIN